MVWIMATWVGVAVLGAGIFSVVRRRYKPVTIPREVQEFVQQLEVEMQEHPQVQLCGMVPGRFAAVFSLRGQEIPASLHHLFRRCTAFPERFKENLARFLDELEQDGVDHPSDHTFAEAAQHLLPQIRHRDWVSLHGGAFGDSSLVHRPLADDLVVCYVIDEPWCMTFVCRAHLRQWNRTEEDLYHLATRNLTTLAGGEVPLPEEGEQVLLRTGDGFDAARVLLLDPDQVEGLLVAIPERDLLWMGAQESSDAELTNLMSLNEEQVEQSHHPISQQVYRMTDGQLVPVGAGDATEPPSRSEDGSAAGPGR